MIINSASNHSDKERQNEDFYATPPRMVSELFDDLPVDLNQSAVWECANGLGHISDRIAELFPDVKMLKTDIIQRTPDTEVYDFMDIDPDTGTYPESVKPFCKDINGKILFDGHIITNPPYFKGTEFLEKACECLAPGRFCAFFVKIQYLETLKRYKVFQKYPPYRVLVSVQRVHCGKDGKFDNDEATGGAACYIWYIYKKDHTGPCTLGWINKETIKKDSSNPLF